MPYRDLDEADDELAVFKAMPAGCTIGCLSWVVVGLSLYWLFH